MTKGRITKRDLEGQLKLVLQEREILEEQVEAASRMTEIFLQVGGWRPSRANWIVMTSVAEQLGKRIQTIERIVRSRADHEPSPSLPKS